MRIESLSRHLATAGVAHVVVAGHTVKASEDTLIGLWTGNSIIFPNSTHAPLTTKYGIRGTSPAKVLYNDDTMTYRAFTYTGDVRDWREGREGIIYSGDSEEYEIKLANPTRSRR